MADEVFGPLVAFTDIEEAILAHYKKWMDTWLSARERAKGIVPRTIHRPRSYIVKQTFTALPGEEQTPLVIVVSNGFRKESMRHGDGSHTAYMRIGVAVMCMGTHARTLAGHYQAALVGIALKHQKVNNFIQIAEFNDLKIDDLDEEAIGRSMAAARLEMTYRVNNFAMEFDAPGTPDTPPIDPEDPQPDSPTVKEGGVHINVEKL